MESLIRWLRDRIRTISRSIDVKQNGPKNPCLFACIAIVIAICATAPSADAQDSSLCSRLIAQLDDSAQAAETRAENARRLRDYGQRIAELKSEQSRLNCSRGSVIIYNSDSGSACAVVSSRMERLEEDVRMINHSSDALTRQDSETARNRILQAMKANGCSFNDAMDMRQSLTLADESIDLNDPTGTYRTMCVRRCDGYYFPISYGSSPAQFDQDASRCENMCPGSRVELYFQSVAEQDSENMLSLDSQTPYLSLPNAFAYRKRAVGSDPQCTCDYPGSKPQDGAASGDTAGSVVLIPTRKNITPLSSHPARTDTADTLQTKRPETNVEDGPVREIDPNRQIRVVGPKFLPDQSEAIDLQAPVPNESR